MHFFKISIFPNLKNTPNLSFTTQNAKKTTIEIHDADLFYVLLIQLKTKSIIDSQN